MNTEERVVVFLMSVFDALMDIVTLGGWSKRRGEERISFFRKDGE
jgi:hypothetical protein